MTTREPHTPWLPVDVARQMAAQMAASARPQTTARVATHWVAHVTGIAPHIAASRRRSLSLVNARCLLADVLLAAGWSYPAAGRVMNRDHSSVYHLANKRTYPEWMAPYREIASRLGVALATPRQPCDAPVLAEPEPPPPPPPPPPRPAVVRRLGRVGRDDSGQRTAARPPTPQQMDDLRRAILREAGVA